MEDKVLKRDALLKCVSELNIDEETRLSILELIKTGQSAKGMRLLRKYRGEVLGNVHADQNRLYQIDFVIQQIDGGRR